MVPLVTTSIYLKILEIGEAETILTVKVQYGWLVYSPMLSPRQLRFSLYSGAVITEGWMW